MKVVPDVERVLKEFHDARKPIGWVSFSLIHKSFLLENFLLVISNISFLIPSIHRLCCISPVLAAKV